MNTRKMRPVGIKVVTRYVIRKSPNTSLSEGAWIALERDSVDALMKRRIRGKTTPIIITFMTFPAEEIAMEI